MQNAQTDTDNIEHSNRLNRIRYRSWHRGCKETDIILGNYCNQFIEGMDNAQLDLFEELLEEDDADIWAWITGKYICENKAYDATLEKLRDFRSYTPL